MEINIEYLMLLWSSLRSQKIHDSGFLVIQKVGNIDFFVLF